MSQLTSAEKEKAHKHLKDIIDTAGITADHQPNYDEVKDVFEKKDFSQVKKDLPSHLQKYTDNEDFDDEELDKDEVMVGISTQAKATHKSHDNSSVEAIRGDAEAKQHSVSSEARASVDFRSLVDHTAQFVQKHAHLTMMSDYDNNLINIKDQEKSSHNAYQVQMIDKDKITAVISSDYLHDSSKFDQHEAFMRHQIQYIESKNQRSVVTVSMDCQSEQDIKSLIATIKIVALSHSLEKDFHLNISFNPNIDLSASSTEKRFMDLVKDKDKIDIGTLKQLLSMSDYNPAAGYKPAV
jgi:hypothetical protein